MEILLQVHCSSLKQVQKENGRSCCRLWQAWKHHAVSARHWNLRKKEKRSFWLVDSFAARIETRIHRRRRHCLYCLHLRHLSMAGEQALIGVVE